MGTTVPFGQDPSERSSHHRSASIESSRRSHGGWLPRFIEIDRGVARDFPYVRGLLARRDSSEGQDTHRIAVLALSGIEACLSILGLLRHGARTCVDLTGAAATAELATGIVMMSIEQAIPACETAPHANGPENPRPSRRRAGPHAVGCACAGGPRRGAALNFARARRAVRAVSRSPCARGTWPRRSCAGLRCRLLVRPAAVQSPLRLAPYTPHPRSFSTHVPGASAPEPSAIP